MGHECGSMTRGGHPNLLCLETDRDMPTSFDGIRRGEAGDA